MTDTIQRLRDLLDKAGKWPNELIVQGDADGSAYYECPACNGEGTVDAECVKHVHAGMVGVQVYGIGDQMAAMEELIPLLIHMTPALLDVFEAARMSQVAFAQGMALESIAHQKLTEALAKLEAIK